MSRYPGRGACSFRPPVTANGAVHSAFSQERLKSEAEIAKLRSLPSPYPEFLDAAPIVLRAHAVGLQHDDRRDQCFRGFVRPDATGAGADRALAVRRAGCARARSRYA